MFSLYKVFKLSQVEYEMISFVATVYLLNNSPTLYMYNTVCCSIEIVTREIDVIVDYRA